MVLGYHIIFGAYGFWLPNDPRGSWSDFVGAWDLYRYGKATKTTETISLAHREHDTKLRIAARKALTYPPVQFSGIQARAIGNGFGDYARKSKLVIWACAILPDHVHLVIGRPHIPVERVVIQLKGKASRSLITERIHPYGRDSGASGRSVKCFARGEWKVYLNTAEDILRAIAYVEDNPVKEGKPRQRWSFVTPFDPTFV